MICTDFRKHRASDLVTITSLPIPEAQRHRGNFFSVDWNLEEKWWNGVKGHYTECASGYHLMCLASFKKKKKKKHWNFPCFIVLRGTTYHQCKTGGRWETDGFFFLKFSHSEINNVIIVLKTKSLILQWSFNPCARSYTENCRNCIVSLLTTTFRSAK